ncbi:MAG TPA: thioredoxin domain-containing protein, partial [Spirochaetota bacterium]
VLEISGSDESRRYIERDLEFARKLGIRRTPTVFIQGRKLSGELSDEYLRRAVEAILNRAE